MKATEMNDWAKYLFKLAVLRDFFEIREIGNLLRERTDFNYTDAALGQYFKGKRKPPPNFFDFVREAMELTEGEYQMLLFIYHQSRPTPTPLQKKQMQHFKEVLMERMIQNLKGDGGLGGASAAS